MSDPIYYTVTAGEQSFEVVLQPLFDAPSASAPRMSAPPAFRPAAEQATWVTARRVAHLPPR